MLVCACEKCASRIPLPLTAMIEDGNIPGVMSGQDTQSRLADMERLISRINADYLARHKCDRPPARPPVAMAAYLCKRCKHEWLTASNVPTPKSCPNCRSRHWQIPPQNPTPRISDISRVCLVCGHTWNARKKERPCACPNCHSPNWDKQPIINHCAKCGYTWEARKATPYLSCPACHSRKWNKKTDFYQENTINKN